MMSIKIAKALPEVGGRVISCGLHERVGSKGGDKVLT
jgi:hypothetical protein